MNDIVLPHNLPAKALRYLYPADSPELISPTKVKRGQVYKIVALREDCAIVSLYAKEKTNIYAVITEKTRGCLPLANLYTFTESGTVKCIMYAWPLFLQEHDGLVRPRNRTFYSIKKLILALHDEPVSK